MTIHYNYAGIESLVGDALREQKALLDMGNHLQAITDSTQDAWDDPESAEAFRAAHRKWVEGSTQLQEALGAVVRAAGQGSDDMNHTNKKIAQVWAH
ncbi:hypothetical protein HUN08_07115 [Gordonia sp. X0973]|uniref:WXG100 family type VII secretion target n=1 Tax=Gordonia sp. X0973 TaxID=2742602 RepID=UPI000F520A7F|nr:WXG100 family type VII secretion target [Gordonia sp. X0973]QKT06987.1 hypothetical protein HUN08_07115 [Gordonia sp. X0973]